MEPRCWAPKRLADSTIGALPLPDALKTAALFPANALDEVSRLLPTLARTDGSDAETLKAFGALWDEVAPRLATADAAAKPSASVSGRGDSSSTVTDGAHADDGAAASGGVDAPALLSTLQNNAGPLLDQLTDDDSPLRRRLPLLGVLSRRFGAKLLNRVAARLEAEADLPGEPSLTKEVAARAAELDRRIAELLEPEPAPVPPAS